MFKCKVCAEKDRRIQDLKSQIETLKQLVVPANDPNQVPIVHLEADGILSAQQHTVQVEEDFPETQNTEELAERDRLLSANY